MLLCRGGSKKCAPGPASYSSQPSACQPGLAQVCMEGCLQEPWQGAAGPGLRFWKFRAGLAGSFTREVKAEFLLPHRGPLDSLPSGHRALADVVAEAPCQVAVLQRDMWWVKLQVSLLALE